MSGDFKTDDNGNIITKPVTGYATGLVMNSAVILAVKFMELRNTDPQTVEEDSIQFVLTPAQCQELSVVLARAAVAVVPRPKDPDAPLN